VGDRPLGTGPCPANVQASGYRMLIGLTMSA
jgi:hypothetical protein